MNVEWFFRLPSLADYPDDLSKLAHVPSSIHYVTFADEVALPGQDGEKADALLQHSKKSGVKVLSELTWEAARRLLRSGLVPSYHGGLFNEEETRQLAFELRRVIAPADLLGRSRIRLRQAHAEKYHEDEPTDFTVFKEPARIGPMEPEQALAYFKKLVPTLGTDPRHWGPLMERQAFTMAEATSLTLLKKVQDVIAKHLEKGSPLPKHSKQAIEDILEEAGVSPKNSGYGEAVFRTNMMEAYRAGAQREFSDPDLRTAFPVWRYIGISDGRERQGPLPKYADHHRWFGKYFDRAVPFVAVRGTEAKDVVNCRCDFVGVPRRRWEKLKQAGAQLERWPQ